LDDSGILASRQIVHLMILEVSGGLPRQFGAFGFRSLTNAREVRMRTWIWAAMLSLVFAVACPPLAAQNSNPVPFLNNPLVPGATVPGGPAFTLTLNGAGFVPGAVVKWNGSARATTYVSNTQLTASILASDIATPASVIVTVSNPNPGGGVSNLVIFEVTTPTTSLAFTRNDNLFNGGVGIGSTVLEPNGMAVGYSPVGDALSLAVVGGQCSVAESCLSAMGTISILTDNGVGENVAFIEPNSGSIVTGDFNGDGVLDFVTLGQNISVSLGESDGYFAISKDYPLPSAEAIASSTPAMGDFNRDGRLDLVIAGYSSVFFLPGNGDGTFGAGDTYSTGAPFGGTNLATGDFNRDGILDLAVTNEMGSTVSILLGNGDGTFQTHADYPTDTYPGAIVTGDFNGDGKLDLAIVNTDANTTVSVFLGNGDGTFQTKVDYPAGISPYSLSLGDYNGDGILDIAVSDTQCTNSGCASSGSVNLLLGNGDGTFQSPLDFAAGDLPESIASGDFLPSDSPAGRSGFAVANYDANTVSVFTPLESQGGSAPTNPVPTVSSLSPMYVVQGSGAFTLTVTGTNFVSGSTVSFGGQAEPTAFVNSTQLTAAIPANALTNAGPVSVVVTAPAPGGGNSSSITFEVYLSSPTISSISPSSVVAGSPGFTLTINGANFASDSILDVNGVARAMTYISSVQVTTAILAGDIANVGALSITMTNMPPSGEGGGGTSSSVTLTVLTPNSQPTIGGLLPASATAGGLQFTLTINGSGFGPSSIVTFGSSIVSSAYASPTQLLAAIPASAIAVAGTPFVTVANPGGAPSLVATFTVNNPVPSANSLSPTSVAPGSAGLTVSIAGTNFNTSSKVLVNNSSRATTYVSSTSLTASLLPSDFAHSGPLSVTVSNPSPGGGSTSALTLTVADFNVTAPAASITVSAGNPATFGLMVAPSNGTLEGTVMFTVSGLPVGASPTFSPASLPAGSTSTNVVLSISTTPHSALAITTFPPRAWPHIPFQSAAEFMIGLMLLGLRLTAAGRSRRFAPQFLILWLLLLAAGLTACGGGSGASSVEQLDTTTGTPAGTYPLTVTATSGNVSLSTSMVLTVD
jgi:hypothetical protein